MKDKTLEAIQVAVIGAGSMGGAIVRGLVKANHSGIQVRVTGTWGNGLQDLSGLDGVEAFDRSERPQAILQAVRGARIVILAVKPHSVLGVLDELAPGLNPGTLVISVAAGIRISSLEEGLPPLTPVIRAMPNTPAVIGRAVTGLSAGTWATERDVELAEDLFRTVGTVISIDESKMDALTSISGSGPAYVYFIIERLAETAEAKGFDAGQAVTLVGETFKGACDLLAASGKSPSELRDAVTSPRGTTAAALSVLGGSGIGDVFAAAIDAAMERAVELGS